MTAKNSYTLGWIGVVAYITAYVLVSTQVLLPTGVIYHLLNALGAIGVIANSLTTKDKPSVAVNSAWLAISIVALSIAIFFRAHA